MNLASHDNGKIQLDFNADSKQDNLISAVIISLFTDARANDEEFKEVQDWELSKRGYWADQLDGVKTGSKLWLLKRASRDQDTLERAKSYTKEALSWLLEDGLAESLEVEASYEQDDLLIAIKTNGDFIKVRYRG